MKSAYDNSPFRRDHQYDVRLLFYRFYSLKSIYRYNKKAKVADDLPSHHTLALML